MDAVKIYEEAARRVGRGEINLMEFWKIIRPLRDVEAVVRCRDCIRYRSDDEVWGRCTVMPYRMRKNDYCSYGVIDDMRKDGDHHEG